MNGDNNYEATTASTTVAAAWMATTTTVWRMRDYAVVEVDPESLIMSSGPRTNMQGTPSTGMPGRTGTPRRNGKCQGGQISGRFHLN